MSWKHWVRPLPAATVTVASSFLAEDGAGVFGVDVHLDDAAVAEEHEGVSLGFQPVFDDRFVKGVQVYFTELEPQEEFRAVAKLQDAVFGEGVQVDGGWFSGGDGFAACCHRFAVEGVSHALGDAQEACAAAVHHTCLFEDVQEFGGVLEAQVHAGDPQVEVLFQAGRSFGRGDAFPQDGEDGAFDGLGDGVVGLADGRFHGLSEGGDIGLLQALEAFGEACEDAGQDDAGVAAGAHEHAL